MIFNQQNKRVLHSLYRSNSVVQFYGLLLKVVRATDCGRTAHSPCGHKAYSRIGFSRCLDPLPTHPDPSLSAELVA